jgi:hypothetical protein
MLRAGIPSNRKQAPMRSIWLPIVLPAVLLLPNAVIAGSSRLRPEAATFSTRAVEKPAGRETYRGQFFDVSAVAERHDVPELVAGLQHQIDVVQDLKLSPRVLSFFQTVPIVVDDFACLGHMTAPSSGEPKPAMEAACYGHQLPAAAKKGGVAAAFVWGNDSSSQSLNSDPLMQTKLTGVIMIRPSTLIDHNKTRPVLLHELLHAYHDRILPGGFANGAAESWFKQASGLYPADQYLMTNEREFFAVTASVFLSGKDGSLVRADIRSKQPEYYKYLKWLFEFDPDTAKDSPVASAN